MLHRTLVLLVVGLVCCSRIANAQKQITFAKRPTQAGQTMVQHALVHTDSVQTYEQSNQVISETDREVRNTQVRHITNLATNPPVVQVTFTEAHLRVGKNRFLAKKTPQSVAQKTYRVCRNGDTLQVTDLAGNQPPADELRIVESTMSWVGQPNQLAEFLNGRTVSEAEELVLPPSVAAKIFGGAVGIETIQQASLMLERVKRINGSQCGVFDVTLIGTPTANDAKQIRIKGQISVEANTCRTAVAEINSELDVSEERGPVGATFTVKNRGKVRIAIRADFADEL